MPNTTAIFYKDNIATFQTSETLFICNVINNYYYCIIAWQCILASPCSGQTSLMAGLGHVSHVRDT